MAFLTVKKNFPLNTLSPKTLEKLLSSTAAKSGAVKGLDVFMENVSRFYEGERVQKRQEENLPDPFFDPKGFVWEDDTRRVRRIRRYQLNEARLRNKNGRYALKMA